MADGHKETARLYLANAMGFYIVSKHIAETADWECFPWPPFFVNAGHAIELGLKAFVLAHGGTENECREVGHDLQQGFKRATQKGLCVPTTNFAQRLTEFGPYYKDHSFRYLRDIPVQNLPNPNEVLGIIGPLLALISEQVI